MLKGRGEEKAGVWGSGVGRVRSDEAWGCDYIRWLQQSRGATCVVAWQNGDQLGGIIMVIFRKKGTTD